MVGQLSRFSALAPNGRRRAALCVLVLAVVGVHGCVTRYLANQMTDIAAAQAMPPRMEVVYVRDMALSTPPPTARAPTFLPAAPTPSRVPRKRIKPPQAASAPVVLAEEEVAEPVVQSSSIPEPPESQEPPVAAVQDPQAESVAVAQSGSAPVNAASTPVADSPGITATAPAAASAPVMASFEWPVSTRVSYVLTGNYRGEVNGNAQVEWIRAGSRYQVHLDLSVGPSFAPLITRRMSSDGEITAAGLTPRRYDQDTKVVMSDRQRINVQFESDFVVLANGERRASLAGVQDTASQFVQLTYLLSTRPELLRVGGTVEMPLALPKKVDVWIYDVVAQETLYTSFGELPTIHLKPRHAAQKSGDLSADIWFAPQLRYLPARIRIQQDASTFIDLMIARPPEMAGGK